MKRHRLKSQNRLPGAVHRFNLFLEPFRGTRRAKLANRVDQHRYGVAVSGLDVPNVADKAAVVHVRTSVADSNNVIGRGDANTSSIAYGRVVGAGGLKIERLKNRWPCCSRRWCC